VAAPATPPSPTGKVTAVRPKISSWGKLCLLGRIAASIIVAILPATGIGAAGAGDIVIGQVADQSGLNLEASRDYIAGAKIYFDFINSQGGVNGHHLVLKVKDDGGVPEKTVSLTRELLETEHAQVLFGYIGDATVNAVAASPLFKKSGIALVGALAGEDVGNGDDALFFIRASYRNEVDRVVDYFARLDIHRFAMVRLSTPFAIGAQRVLRSSLNANSMQLVGDDAMASDGSDAMQVAHKIYAGHPQVVVIVGDTIAVGNFIRAYRPLDQGGFVVALSTVNHDALLQLVGPGLAHGTLITQVVPNPLLANGPALREHTGLLRRFRDEPPSHLTLEGFLAAKTLVQALHGLSRDVSRNAITGILRQHRDYDLGGIPLHFAEGSNRGSSFVDLTLLRKDGTLVQ
jgi:ABC-type branched-subunit amino acid transport system substrate-binding protein